MSEAGAQAQPIERSARSAEIVDTAQRILDSDGHEALTMRRLAEEIGIRAPSLYKHFPNKRAVEAALVDNALASMGEKLHAALKRAAPARQVETLLGAYRQESLGRPNLYRLATGPGLPRDQLTPGLEEWSGEPFFLATGEPCLAQALWAFAHGMAILEIENRFMDDSDLDRTWAEGAQAFASLVMARSGE